VLTLVRGGEEDVDLPVDLTQPRREPFVVELDAVALAPAMEFALLVRTCARGTDTSRWAGRLVDLGQVDVRLQVASALRRLEQDRDLGLPDRAVVLTFRNDAGTELAKGTIEPKGDGQFSAWTHYPDGTGSGMDNTQAEVWAKLRTHAVTVTVESEGRQPVTRRFLPHEVAGEEVAFVLVLPAK